jgi:predicted translin family RNA/ssDNA-binding protein
MSYQLFSSTESFEAILERLEARSKARQDVGARSGLALRHAKKSIFALQRRADPDAAYEELAQSRELLGALQTEYGAPDKAIHGQWMVALEELLEGVFFLRFCEEKPLTLTNDELLEFDRGDGNREPLIVDDETVLGAISDFTGEAYRQMQLWISDGAYEHALRAHNAIAEATELLNQNTSGGNLRNKVDQANRNLHNADARRTDLKMRGLI